MSATQCDACPHAISDHAEAMHGPGFCLAAGCDCTGPTAVWYAPTDVRPFSNGTEGYDWMAANCDRCQKNGPYNRQGEGPCPMETAVSRGFILGTVPADLAVEYGARLHEQPGYCSMPRQCSQFVPLGACESIATRNRRKCGKPTEQTVEHEGRTRAACPRHKRAYLASVAAESVDAPAPATVGT